MDDQDPGGISPLQQMVASGAGAVVTSLFMTPLDVVKVRLQSQRPSATSELTTPSRFWSLSYTKSSSALQSPGKCLLYCNGVLEPLYLCPNGTRCATWFQDPTRFTGTLDAFVKIVRHEGTRTLWSGLPATLVMTVPATAIYFTAYDQLKAFLCGQSLTSDLYAPMVAGALARMGTVTVVSPLELVRTKLQAQHVSYRELASSVQAAVTQGGWRSLWLGWGPTALRDVPFSALYWFNYELVKSWLSGLRPKDQTSVGISFVAGGISGMVAATLTLPFDVVKTQRQMSLGAVEAVRVKPPRVDSTWLLLRRIRAESGTRGLFAGFLPRIIKAAPSCAIMISTYEFGKSFFQRLNQEQPLGR
ncbi:probable mitochondrial glutathione transporter SLC25A39 isoform X1 [Mus musculus]|uniref:Mitochondrial glutathione transporter SLC25A39 n=7 Tax=Mus TaxID=862507 RepID=S2539_MOUSE|nr:probable mitochondrial glutathione transporter SLC25A39 [Mus musculus]XP_006534097.1 probable mitochondrial glutathione transporter SLC25A39 isoform X1 [Mus musculus]XP_006534098.1 probable mitochondrial glutathione transporter SLC25A39 isoform X1 [Mus musculus]XP_030102115.1 probable mitochondrial glutathione transporter SLC25A39 isoform X1 [Mus musculus]Q9D8K8.1 RecName: Full=Probable mitochondrial glutathione transporter SLC25A39; AltName: Full=Solute carrier family 25 member 39 [Mus musc|eukprot:NP_080818.1 solute carrier family 25 member 39 [Mus musculus]